MLKCKKCESSYIMSRFARFYYKNELTKNKLYSMIQKNIMKSVYFESNSHIEMTENIKEMGSWNLEQRVHQEMKSTMIPRD